MKTLGLYIHIPFCVRKCKYCDFVSYPDVSRKEQLDYVDFICDEIVKNGAKCRENYIVDSIFFGGGTPTVLEAEELIKILDCINNNFIVTQDKKALELSFEANPGTINRKKLEKLKAAGFNRISIGVQSFDDKVLKMLGRIHDSKTASEAVKMAISCGFNTNLDLMLGVPEQDLESFKSSINEAISLNPQHISFYSLQLEEGTPLYNEYRFGDLSLPSWEENRAMYHMACDTLKQAGYHHYEISNAAKPGYECKHNIKYWSLEDYLGIGLSAHSFMAGRRTGVCDADPKGDFIFTRLRLIDGFPKNEYFERFGISFEDEFGEVYKKQLDDGLLTEENGMIKFTKKGLDFTNPCMQVLLEVIRR